MVCTVKDGGTRKAELERVGRMEPEAKVFMTIDMTEAMVGTCKDGIRAANPTITEEELMKKLSERLRYSRRLQGRGGHVK